MALIDLTSNIIGWWRLYEESGTVVDDLQNSNDGSTTDNISTITSLLAPDGRLRSFDISGINNKKVTVSDSSDFTFSNVAGDLPFSASVWVNYTSPGGHALSKMSTGVVGGGEYYCHMMSGGGIVFLLFDQTTGGYAFRSFNTGITINDGQWHHIVFTYDGRGSLPFLSTTHQGMKAYMDGVAASPVWQTTSNNYYQMRNSSDNLVIGGRDAASNIFDGKLSDAIIFDKELADGEIRYLYNDGLGLEPSQTSTIDVISSATIVYPNGGEIFTEGDINIQWTEPGNLSSTELTWYEIFITDDFEKNLKKEELIQIATIPSGNTSYNYTIQQNLRGKRCKIGVRSVNNHGRRSNMSFSAGNFTIINESLPSPVVLEPVRGSTYFSYIPFVFDHQGVLGRSSQRSLYQIYYKSDALDIDWTLLRGSIMVGSDPINIDVSNFATNSDYSIKVELVDTDSVSAPVFIENININNINFFMIDTEPPSGTIKIINNEEYTQNTSLILNVLASDKETAVKDVKIWQTNTQTGSGASSPDYVEMSPLITWDIKEDVEGEGIVDGVKLIQASFRDYGNNSVELGEIVSTEKFFRTYKNLDNKLVTAMIYDETATTDDLYYAFASDSTSGSSAELYKNLSLVSTLDGDVTSLQIYNSILYVAIKDDENKGVLQRLSGGSIETVGDNDQQFLDASETVVNSLYLTDSIINAMVVFDSALFLGLDNGTLLSFKGSSIALEHNDYLNVKSIRNIETDGNMLYIFFYNTTEILIMNLDSSGDYVFSTVDTGS